MCPLKSRPSSWSKGSTRPSPPVSQACWAGPSTWPPPRLKRSLPPDTQRQPALNAPPPVAQARSEARCNPPRPVAARAKRRQVGRPPATPQLEVGLQPNQSSSGEDPCFHIRVRLRQVPASATSNSNLPAPRRCRRLACPPAKARQREPGRHRDQRHAGLVNSAPYANWKLGARPHTGPAAQPLALLC